MNERFFLIDCGEGTQIQLRRFRLSPARINHIFISHLHGDHIFGLFGLISSLGLMGRKAKLHLYGPTGLEEMISGTLEFFGKIPFELVFHIAEDDKILFRDSKTEVIPIRLLHRTETFGYLFRERPRMLNVDKKKIAEYGLGIADIKNIKEGRDHLLDDGSIIPNRELTLPPFKQRAYAYISDTAYLPEIAARLKGVDLLFHEATFLEKDLHLAKETFHSTARQAAMVAHEAYAGKLLIGHFSTRYKSEKAFVHEAREIFSDTIAVNDGDRFSVELTRVKRE